MRQVLTEKIEDISHAVYWAIEPGPVNKGRAPVAELFRFSDGVENNGQEVFLFTINPKPSVMPSYKSYFLLTGEFNKLEIMTGEIYLNPRLDPVVKNSVLEAIYYPGPFGFIDEIIDYFRHTLGYKFLSPEFSNRTISISEFRSKHCGM